MMFSDNIQNLATDITMHIMHILQQYTRGYITGVNSNRWTQHVVVDTRLNVYMYSYKFV